MKLSIFSITARLSVVWIIISLGWLLPTDARAQEGGIIWGEPINISRTPDGTSTDPFLLADPAGVIHLFWAEKTSNQPTNNPDTLMYARWDGSNWSEPIDIFFSPEEHGNQIVQFPHAVLDDQGTIHLVWMTQPNFPNYALFYSSVPASKANNATAWKPATTLAGDLTGTNYGLDIQVDAFNNVHIVYARVPTGDNAKELRSVSYIKSVDGGESWSEPLDIYTIPDSRSGASNNRLTVDSTGNLFTTWSEWDQSGNGQAIFFSRSMDNGISWEHPTILTKRIGSEYERDWNSIAILDSEHLVSIYEGGWRAYRNIMYSYDGGLTWTMPVDAFPGLIGENGFIDFVRDSAGTLHIFFANRTREGNTLRTGEGLWHSVWMGNESWSEPFLSSPNINMLNPKTVIMNGNQVMTAWYTGSDREIMVMAGKIVDAPALEPIIWAAITPNPSITPSPEPTQVIDTPTPTEPKPVTANIPINNTNQPKSSSPSIGVISGLAATLLTILGILAIYKLSRKQFTN